MLAFYFIIKTMNTAIVWFRQDLRISDNPALRNAVQQNKTIIPLYIFDTSIPKKHQLGGAQRWWLYHSLTSLTTQLQKYQNKLILRQGEPLKILLAIIKKTNANTIYWNRCYEPYAIKRDQKIQELLEKNGIMVKTFNGSLLFEPWEIKNNSGNYFKVFTPFWKKCLSQKEPAFPLDKPKIPKLRLNIPTENLKNWQLLPEKPDWATGIKETWQAGEPHAQQQLKTFVAKKLIHYHQRDFAALDVTSMLSPYLHFGEISPRQIWHAVQIATLKNVALTANTKKFLSELGWREFSYHLLYHFPTLAEDSFRKDFENFPWQKKLSHLKAWQQGKTGYPIVDAGMRQLWYCGWMHNRVRMIVASFLIKDLLIDWRIGAAWFWDTLVDADLANNSASWQWVAGSGADASPYFRIFNPTLQGKKFDPQGDYVKRWLPELKNLPKKFIHEPWLAPEKTDYPAPIIQHEHARKIALAQYKKLKKFV